MSVMDFSFQNANKKGKMETAFFDWSWLGQQN